MVDRIQDEYLSRQSAIVPPTASDLSVAVFGIGGIGSNAAYTLASMGVREFHLVDFDHIEEANVYPGWFQPGDVGQMKATATANRLLNEFMRVEATDHIGEVGNLHADEFPDFDVGLAVTDNMESRREAWRFALRKRNMPKLWVDARMGGPGYTVVAFPLSDEAAATRYNDVESEMSNVELACGEKATAMITKGAIPFIIGSIVRKFLQGKRFPYIFTGDADRLDLLLATNAPD